MFCPLGTVSFRFQASGKLPFTLKEKHIHSLKVKRGRFLNSANSWHKTIWVEGILWHSPSTNLSRKGNSKKDDSWHQIIFSIAQGSTFCAPGDTVGLCGLVFGNKRFPKKPPCQKFQLCDVQSVQYLLRLGQRGADSNLRWLHFHGIQLLS